MARRSMSPAREGHRRHRYGSDGPLGNRSRRRSPVSASEDERDQKARHRGRRASESSTSDHRHHRRDMSSDRADGGRRSRSSYRSTGRGSGYTNIERAEGRSRSRSPYRPTDRAAERTKDWCADARSRSRSRSPYRAKRRTDDRDRSRSRSPYRSKGRSSGHRSVDRDVSPERDDRKRRRRDQSRSDSIERRHRKHRSRSPNGDRRRRKERSRSRSKDRSGRGDHSRSHNEDRRRRKERSRSRSRDHKRRRRSHSRSASPPARSRKPLPSQEQSFRGDVTAEPVVEKQKPNFGATGLLAKESNIVAGTKIVLKYNEPSEARKPPASQPWRIYVFKGSEIVDTIELHTQSCWLIGREAKVTDILALHPSISSQHAVIQFRHSVKMNEWGEKKGMVRPYLIDLGSSNGTILNDEEVEPSRYVELRDKDMIKFGLSEREYVVMLPKPGEA